MRISQSNNGSVNEKLCNSFYLVHSLKKANLTIRPSAMFEVWFFIDIFKLNQDCTKTIFWALKSMIFKSYLYNNIILWQ